MFPMFNTLRKLFRKFITLLPNNIPWQRGWFIILLTPRKIYNSFLILNDIDSVDDYDDDGIAAAGDDDDDSHQYGGDKCLLLL